MRKRKKFDGLAEPENPTESGTKVVEIEILAQLVLSEIVDRTFKTTA